MAKSMFVPPGGFAGFAQQSPAVQALVRRSPAKKRRKTVRKKRPVKKRATRRKRRTTPARPRRTARKKPARMVKGSAAAKRHMAKLRRMRRKS